MEARLKAVELLDKYRTIVRKTDVVSEDEIYLSKQCVLIALNEIIRLDIFDCNCEWSDEDGDTKEYWIEVKQEIEKYD